jgi:hypothetical protein
VVVVEVVIVVRVDAMNGDQHGGRTALRPVEIIKYWKDALRNKLVRAA